MGFKTTIQVINREKSQQYFINFPAACAKMLGLRKGEVVEWEITDQGDLLLKRSGKKDSANARGAEGDTEQ